MGAHISPERAQELLDDATPGPWRISTTEGIGGLGFAEDFYQDDPREKANVALAAAAPELAQTIAGMRYEYAVQVSTDGGESWRFAHGGTKSTPDPIDPCWWFRTEEEARDFAKFRTTKRSSARVVRRLVTDVEVVE